MNNVSSPRTDDESVEQEIKRKGLIAPRVTPADIQDNIVKAVYFTAAEGIGGHAMANDDHGVAINSEHTLLTFCVLTLRNGFTVTGESACASAENFDAGLGQRIARQNAEAKLWPLMGYALKERLSAAPAGVPFDAIPTRTARPQLQMTLTFDDCPQNTVLVRQRPPFGWQLQAMIRDELNQKQAAVFRVEANEPPPADWLRLFTGLVEWSVFGPDGVHGDTRTA